MYMSDTLNLANSIWPNGMKVDSDGHAVFYPLGTNKIEVPTSCTQWPKGNRLVSPYVYDKDDKLVGFVDTKALTVSGNTTIYLPYEHIEAEFSAINKGRLQIHAPNATTKKASWKDRGKADITEAQYKYIGYTDLAHMKNDYPYEYLADISNGSWTEPLFDLTKGGNMFYNTSALLAFESDMPSLEFGYYMFAACANLTSFASDMSSLTDGTLMFYNCTALTSFTSKLSSLTNGEDMFSYCDNLSEFDTDLPSLTNGEKMFYNCTALTTFTSDLSNLGNGEGMFSYCDNLTTFTSDLSDLMIGNYMFAYCDNLSEFDTDLPSLRNGSYMFAWCPQLESFSSDLSDLQTGYWMFHGSKLTSFSTELPSLYSAENMFYNCTALTSFTSKLSSLTNGEDMFSYCDNLTSFTSNLSSLTNGRSMFNYCTNLKSFSSDLSSLTDGWHMFNNCSALTSFSSDLSSLTNGEYMFRYCKLDTASIKNIAETIKTVTNSPSISIGIANSSPSEEENTYFTLIHNKGWRAYVNGSSLHYVPAPPPSPYVSLDETGESTSTPIPFWAKPEPATEETAKYIDENGNFFNILGGQFIYVDDPETYGMLTCEEDAAANMRLTPYIKPIENQ